MALAVLASPALAQAQDSAHDVADRPRLELGAGGGVFYSGGTLPYTTGMVDARIGVKLSRRWSVEGVVHFTPSTGADVSGYYHAQAVWRFGRGASQPFLTFGGAGEFSRWSWPEYRYEAYDTGELRVVPARSGVHVGPPWYPTAGIGIEKVLASHLAIRAELTAGFGINDYGLAVALLPAVSVSIPIGRYTKPAG